MIKDLNLNHLVSGGKFQTCVVYDMAFKGYDDEECALSYCFACSLKSKVFFKLKGICGESGSGLDIIDTDYLLMFGYPHKNSFHFRGFTGLTSIYFEEANQRWILNSYRSELMNPLSFFTLGSYCLDKSKNTEKFTFKFS